MLRNRVYRLGNVHIWVVLSVKVVDLMMFRNCVFKLRKNSRMGCADLQEGRFADCQEWRFRLRNVQIRAVPSSKSVDLLMLRNRVFRVPSVQICAVLTSNVVDFLILRNRVFRLRNFQKWAVQSRKGVDLLMLKNRVFRLRIVEIWEMPSCKRVD